MPPGPKIRTLDRARLVEGFASLQGEGFRVGEYQIFLRLAVCDRRCVYCDTPESIGKAPPTASFQVTPEDPRREEVPNPISADELERRTEALIIPGSVPTLSITGGEPLLQAGFLRGWLPRLKGRVRRSLETHGFLPDRLAEVVPELEAVVLDLKVPSATGEPTDWEEHLQAIEVVRKAGIELTLKAVVDAKLEPAELERIFECFEAAPGANLVLQPLSAFAKAQDVPASRDLLRWVRSGLGRGLAVRVVPQVHKWMGLD